MTDLPYRQAFDRIRGEYFEMPGMRLTPAQVQRLSGVDVAICARVLDDLVAARFLLKERDGSYARSSDGGGSIRSRMAKAAGDRRHLRSASRRAS